MVEIEIGGRKWPLRATIGAWKRFEETTGKRVADMQENENDVTMFCTLAFHFVVAGCKANGTEFRMSLDDFLDSIELHQMQDIANAIADVMGAKVQKKTLAQRK
jgi:hypothetical protein